jgi:hypothetical protein
MMNMLVSVQMCDETNTPITSVVLENMKKDTSYYNKTIFEIRLAIYNLIYQAVRNLAIIQYTIFMTLIIKFDLGIKLNTKMVKILSKLSFTICDKIHWLLI